MVRTAVLLVGVLVAVAVESSSLTQRVDRIEMTNPDAYEIYATVIPHQVAVRIKGGKRLVIQRETGTFKDCMPHGGVLETEWRAAVENYKSENAAVRVILPDQPLGFPYVIVSTAEIRSLFKGPPDWTEFYRRYPDSGGFIEMSAAGFDSSKTHAMVYMATRCGGLCARGTYHFLEKVGDKWRAARVPDVINCAWGS